MSYTARSVCSETENYLSKREDIIRLNRQVGETCEDFLACYESFLSGSEKCQTKSLIWGVRSIREYKNRFLVQVLMASYKVWNESHMRYLELLDAVKENNPEWVERIMRDHESKIKNCKVSVYPLKEALTA